MNFLFWCLMTLLFVKWFFPNKSKYDYWPVILLAVLLSGCEEREKQRVPPKTTPIVCHRC